MEMDFELEANIRNMFIEAYSDMFNRFRGECMKKLHNMNDNNKGSMKEKRKIYYVANKEPKKEHHKHFYTAYKAYSDAKHKDDVKKCNYDEVNDKIYSSAHEEDMRQVGRMHMEANKKSSMEKLKQYNEEQKDNLKRFNNKLADLKNEKSPWELVKTEKNIVPPWESWEQNDTERNDFKKFCNECKQYFDVEKARFDELKAMRNKIEIPSSDAGDILDTNFFADLLKDI